MKKVLTFFSFLLFVAFSKAQSGIDCNNAIPFSNNNSCIDNNTQSGTEMWFSFIADNLLLSVNLQKQLSSAEFVNKFELYSGSCGFLTLVDSDTISDNNDSLLSMNVLSTIGNTYYLRVFKQNIITIPTYNLCLKSSAGGSHSLFLCATGDVYEAGANFGGITPVLVPGISGVIAVSAGGASHNLALLASGDVWAWGLNNYGQLGRTGPDDFINPSMVLGLPGPATAISAGDGHSLAIVAGQVYAWGYNTAGELGDGFFNTFVNQNPTLVTSLPSNIVAISAGDLHSMALTATGDVYTWGYNFYGQLGNGTTFYPQVTPLLVFTGAQAISAGEGSSVILDCSGKVWGTGYNGPGSQLGDGLTTNSLSFVFSTNLNAFGTFTSISTSNATLALRSDATVWACGSNFSGERGDGTFFTSPTVTQTFGLANINSISAGWMHGIAIDNSGAGFAWGSNFDGQLGIGLPAPPNSYNLPQSPLVPCILAIAVPAVSSLVITGVNTICSGSSTTLTVSGGMTPYTWSGPGLSSTTGATVIATPLVTSTYTVSSCGGGTATITITVDPTCCTGAFTVSSGNDITGSTFALGVTSFSGTTIAVNSNLTIGAPTNFTNCTLLFAPNTKITIPSGQILVIDKSDLYSCGLQMWDGIEILPGGNLIITKSLIEDAKIAVWSKNAGGVANFTIDKITFNRNYINVKVENYTGPLHPGRIRSSTFGSAASITSTTNTAFLDAPFSSQVAEKGVYLFNVNSIQIGDPLSPAYQNDFIYLKIGIHAEGSVYSAYNNSFHNGVLATTLCPGCPQGWAIWNNKTKAVIGGAGSGQPNKFKDITNGIMHENGYYLDAFYNTFDNMIYTGFFVTGGTAILTRNFTQAGVIRIAFNDIKNVKTGLHHQNNFTTSYTAQGNLFKNFNSRGIYCVQNSYGSISILTNDFNQSASSVYTGDIGVEISNAVLALSASPLINVSSNTIYRMNKGILLIKVNRPQVKNNNIAFKSTIVPSGSAFYYGIRSLDSNGEYIYQNIISKGGANPTSTFEYGVYGITVETNQTYVSVLENNTAKAGTGLRFRGYTNYGSTVRCNILNRNFSGLGLDAVAIGTQGAPVSGTNPLGIASDNNWTNPSLVAGSVAARGAGAFSPPDVYTRSSGYPWCPLLVHVSPGNTIHTINSTIPLTGGVVGSAPTSCSNLCGTPPYPICMHSPILAKIARNEAPFDAVSGTQRYTMHEGLLRGVLSDSIPLDTTNADDLALKIFIDDALINASVGQLVNVGIKYADGDTTGAVTLNASVITTTCADNYHKIVNGIFFNTWGIGNFYISPPDSLTLYNIAIQDPLDCGTAIYDARVMLGIDINDFTAPGHMMQPFDESGLAVEDKIGVLYPNPAQHSCTYEATLTETQSGFIMMYDLNGKLLQSYKLNSGENKLEMDLSTFSNGVYMYQIVINGETIEHKKLVIQK